MFSLKKPGASFKEISIKSIWYGLIAGMISGMVKIGWESIFPPRTIARNLINPPQHMAMQLGIPKKLVESRGVIKEIDGEEWFGTEPWYKFVDPYEHLKDYKIMDYIKLI